MCIAATLEHRRPASHVLTSTREPQREMSCHMRVHKFASFAFSHALAHDVKRTKTNETKPISRLRGGGQAGLASPNLRYIYIYIHVFVLHKELYQLYGQSRFRLCMESMDLTGKYQVKVNCSWKPWYAQMVVTVILSVALCVKRKSRGVTTQQ